jgi:hypothetical protein
MKTKHVDFISVIVPSVTGALFLSKCISSLLKEKGSNYEIIVVFDGALKKNAAKIKSIWSRKKKVIFLELPYTKGASYARNFGADKSKGDYLFFIDDDTLVKPGWSKQIPFFFKNNKDTGIAIPKILSLGTNTYESAGELISSYGFLIERAQKAIDHGQFDTNSLLFSGKSAGMIVLKKCFKQINGFNVEFIIFWEDTDLCWRMQLAGKKVRFFHQITVFHSYRLKNTSKKKYIDNQVVYRGCKNMLSSCLYNLSIKKLLAVFPIVVLSMLFLSIGSFFYKDFFRSKSICRALYWHLIHIRYTLHIRKQVQSNRVLPDKAIFKEITVKRSLMYYVKKARAYSSNTEY